MVSTTFSVKINMKMMSEFSSIDIINEDKMMVISKLSQSREDRVQKTLVFILSHLKRNILFISKGKRQQN